MLSNSLRRWPDFRREEAAEAEGIGGQAAGDERRQKADAPGIGTTGT